MPHRLKVSFESEVMKVELDGVEITSIKAIIMKSTGVSINCNLTHSSFGCELTSQEGEIEFVIPDSIYEALKS